MTIKQARTQANLTQQQMSDLLEIPLRTIVSWESESDKAGRKCPVWAEKLIIEKLEEIRMRKGYVVNFGTGAGNEELESLESAKTFAVDNCSYTGESIKIEQGGEEVATLPFYGVAAADDDVVSADFGDNGFYGEWEER